MEEICSTHRKERLMETATIKPVWNLKFRKYGNVSYCLMTYFEKSYGIFFSLEKFFNPGIMSLFSSMGHLIPSILSKKLGFIE